MRGTRPCYRATCSSRLAAPTPFGVTPPTASREGDSGYFLQSELHWNVAPSIDLFALADFGEAFSTFPARTTMMSIGAGVSYTGEHFGAELAVAAPMLDAVADQQNVAVYAKMTGTFN